MCVSTLLTRCYLLWAHCKQGRTKANGRRSETEIKNFTDRLNRCHPLLYLVSKATLVPLLTTHIGSKQAVFVIPLVIMSYSGGNCLGTWWQCFARSRGSQVWHMKSLVTLHSFPRWYKSMTALHVFTLCSFLKCQPANSGTCELLTVIHSSPNY